MHPLTLLTCPPLPVRHRAFIQTKRRNNRLYRTAVCEQRHHRDEQRARLIHLVKRRVRGSAERLVAPCAAIPLLRAATDHSRARPFTPIDPTLPVVAHLLLRVYAGPPCRLQAPTRLPQNSSRFNSSPLPPFSGTTPIGAIASKSVSGISQQLTHFRRRFSCLPAVSPTSSHWSWVYQDTNPCAHRRFSGDCPVRERHLRYSNLDAIALLPLLSFVDLIVYKPYYMHTNLVEPMRDRKRIAWIKTHPAQYRAVQCIAI